MSQTVVEQVGRYAEKYGCECLYPAGGTWLERGQVALRLRRVGFMHWKRKHPKPFNMATFSWDDGAEKVKVGKWRLSPAEREELVLGLIGEGVPDGDIRRYANCGQEFVASRRKQAPAVEAGLEALRERPLSASEAADFLDAYCAE